MTGNGSKLPWTHYAAEGKHFRGFTLDTCETCGRTIQAANSVQLLEPAWRLNGLGLIGPIGLPPEGHHDDETGREVCDRPDCKTFRPICEGCDDPDAEEIQGYDVTNHEGKTERVAYCRECAALARADWNGEVESIVPAPEPDFGPPWRETEPFPGEPPFTGEG